MSNTPNQATIADPHWAGGDRRRQLQTNEFFDYLWGAPRPPAILFRTLGFAITMPAEEPAPASQPPGWKRLPLGSIVLFGRYLAFLGAVEGALEVTPGAGGASAWRRVVGNGPLRMGSDAYTRLSPTERTRLKEPLLRPESIIVPVAEITATHGDRWGDGPCLKVVTRRSALVLGPHPAASKTGGDRISLGVATRWEPRLEALVNSLIASRTVVPSRDPERISWEEHPR